MVSSRPPHQRMRMALLVSDQAFLISNRKRPMPMLAGSILEHRRLLALDGIQP